MNSPQHLATFCKDDEGKIFQLTVYDHDNQPHSIVHDGKVLEDSNVYFVFAVSPIFLLIAMYYQKCPTGDQFVDISFDLKMMTFLTTIRLDLLYDLNLDQNGVTLGVKLSEEKCFKVFEMFVKCSTSNQIADRVFSIRWSITGTDPPEKSLIANGLEMLRDLIVEPLFLKFCKHINMVPLSDSAVLKKMHDMDNPTSNFANHTNKKAKKAPEPVKAKPITDFFKPKCK